MATYRRRLTVEAEQFWPAKKPWPKGVLGDPDPGVYWLDTGNDVLRLVAGDWVVANGDETYLVEPREVCTAVMFPCRYEPVPWPSDSREDR